MRSAKRILLGFLGIIFIISLTACTKSTTDNAITTSGTDLLTVNGEVVSVPLINYYLYTASQQVAQQYDIASSDWQTTQIDNVTANEYVREQASLQIENLYLEHQKLGRDLTADEQTQVDNLKTMYQNAYGANYEQELSSQGLTPDAMNLKLTYTVEGQILQNQTLSQTSDADLKDFYQNNMMQIKQIFVSKRDKTTNALLTGDKQTAAQTKIQTALAKAQNGTNFDTLVKEYNEDPGMSSNPNGYLISDADPSYDRLWILTAHDLKDNQISDIFETEAGWYILEKVPIDASAYDANLSTIKQEYWLYLQNAWRTTANIVINAKMWNEIDISKGLQNNFL